MKQQPIAFDGQVLVDHILRHDVEVLSIHVADDRGDWRRLAAIMCGEEPTDRELLELGRIIFLAVTK